MLNPLWARSFTKGKVFAMQKLYNFQIKSMSIFDLTLAFFFDISLASFKNSSMDIPAMDQIISFNILKQLWIVRGSVFLDPMVLVWWGVYWTCKSMNKRSPSIQDYIFGVSSLKLKVYSPHW